MQIANNSSVYNYHEKIERIISIRETLIGNNLLIHCENIVFLKTSLK